MQRDWNLYIPESEGYEQRARATIHEAPTNLYIKSGTNGASNTNQLNMATLELSVRLVVDLSYRTYGA
jgi:hypothetical protein